MSDALYATRNEGGSGRPHVTRPLVASSTVSQSSSLRQRLRVYGLAFTSLLAAVLAGVLLLEPTLLRAAHPLPLAGAFALIAALTLVLANRLRTHDE